MPRNYLPYLALFGANLIYAINYGLAKEVMGDGYLKSFAFIMFRAVGAVLLFWMVSMFTTSERVEKRDYVKLLFCGVFGVALNQLMFFEGLHHTSTINASIIMVTNPILVLVMATLILREKLSWRRVIGVMVGLTGCIALILFKGSDGDSQSSLKGDLFIFFNAASYGVYLVLVKPLMQKYTPLTVIKWVFTFGTILVLPFGLSQYGDIEWNMPMDIILKIIFVIVFTTFFAYLLNIYGLKKVSPTVASSFIYLQPILTTLIAVGVGTESITWQKVAYGSLIFIGVFIVSFPNKKVNPEKLETRGE